MTIGVHSVGNQAPYSDIGMDYQPTAITSQWQEKILTFSVKEGIPAGNYRLPAIYMGANIGSVDVADVSLVKTD